jgi:hypothetical protein
MFVIYVYLLFLFFFACFVLFIYYFFIFLFINFICCQFVHLLCFICARLTIVNLCYVVKGSCILLAFVKNSLLHLRIFSLAYILHYASCED